MSVLCYQVVYFSPNPTTEWKIPWAFIIETAVRRYRRLQSGLVFSAETTGSERSAELANRCWSRFDHEGDFLALGPHFSRGEWHPIPSCVPDLDAWLLAMVKP